MAGVNYKNYQAPDGPVTMPTNIKITDNKSVMDEIINHVKTWKSDLNKQEKKDWRSKLQELTGQLC